MEQEKITTIIKTYNSDSTLCETLESIRLLDEIIIIDCNSTDDTIDIAKEYKTKLIYSDKNDLSMALNQAIGEAKNNWIFILEDDEIIPEKLIVELQNYINNPKKQKNIVELPIEYFYLNNKIKAGRTRKIRLFKKGCAELKNNFSLELQTKNKVFKFNRNFKIKNGYILKYPKNDIQKSYFDFIEKNKNISKASNKKSVSVFRKPILTFIYFYFIKKAFLNGKIGFIFSINKMIERYILEVMLLEKTKDIE